MDSERGRVMAVRLENYMFRSDVGTYEEINKLISDGKVKINGVVKTDNNYKVDTLSDFVEVNDALLFYRRYVYLMLNKPAGFSAKANDRHYKTIFSMLPDWCARRGLKPVNMLDIDLSGLVILTDDEGLRIFEASQKKNKDMVYHVQTDKPAAIKHVDAFSNGMKMRDFTGQIAQLSKTESYYKDEFASRVTTKECGYEDIRRMFNAIGIKVISAELIAYGDIILPIELETGAWRELKVNELEILNIKNPYA